MRNPVITFHTLLKFWCLSKIFALSYPLVSFCIDLRMRRWAPCDPNVLLAGTGSTHLQTKEEAWYISRTRPRFIWKSATSPHFFSFDLFIMNTGKVVVLVWQNKTFYIQLFIVLCIFGLLLFSC